MTGEAGSVSAPQDRLAEKLPWLAVASAGLSADLWSKHLVFYPYVISRHAAQAEEPPSMGCRDVRGGDDCDPECRRETDP